MGEDRQAAQKTVVIFVGIGGATCSGKTTLAKHLKRIIPNSVIVHQDDFAPPQELIPIHPIYQVQDWDSAAGAIDWPRLRAFLRKVKETGQMPADHKSHDHLNEQRDLNISDEAFVKWQEIFTELYQQQQGQGLSVTWALVDGFLLYWDKEVIDELDIRLFLRTPHDILRRRREERSGYHTAVQSDPEGTYWQDPPGYWEQIVYPAYVDAHQRLFEAGDVENGKLKEDEDVKIDDFVILEGKDTTMTEMVERSCEVLLSRGDGKLR